MFETLFSYWMRKFLTFCIEPEALEVLHHLTDKSDDTSVLSFGKWLMTIDHRISGSRES